MVSLKGITVEIDGNVTGLTKALSSLNGDIKNTTAQLKDVERLLKLDPGNTELLAQKQKLLSQAVEETKKKLDALKQASNEAAKTAGNYDAWKAKYDPLKKEIDETQTKLKTLKDKAADADKQLSEGKISQKKYDDLQAEIKETEERLKTLKTQAKEVDEEFGHPISHEQYDALQREIIATENSLKSLEKQSKEAGSKLQDLAAKGAKLKDIGSSITSAGEKFLPVTAAVAALGTAVVKTTAEFDSQMSRVKAISGATEKQFDSLRDKAREMGATTKYSAKEAGEAMEYMAMAGWDSEQMLAGIEGVMNLAAASGENLATSVR